MQIKKLHRASPEQVFITVRNNDSVVMSVGHAAMFDNQVRAAATGADTNFDGYSVRFNITTATQQINPCLFAGIVANNDLQVGGYGLVQVYGLHDGVYITGASALPFDGATVFQATNRTALSLRQIILKPVAINANTTGAVATQGLLGAISLSATITNLSTVTTLDPAHFFPGPFCVPLGQLNGGVTITYTSSGSVKAFIRCL